MSDLTTGEQLDAALAAQKERTDAAADAAADALTQAQAALIQANTNAFNITDLTNRVLSLEQGTPPDPPDPPDPDSTPPGISPELYHAYHALPDLALHGYEILLPERITMEGMRYWPRDIREAVPVTTDGQILNEVQNYQGWDLLTMPQGGGAHWALTNNYVRLYLTKPATIAVATIGAGTGPLPPGLTTDGWNYDGHIQRQWKTSGRTTQEPVVVKEFPAGEALIPAINKPANNNETRYYVIMIGEPNHQPPAPLPTTLAEHAVPPPGTILSLDHWMHQTHQIKHDNQWFRTWHPQQDRKLGTFYNHEHRNDPETFLRDAWIEGLTPQQTRPIIAPKWNSVYPPEHEHPFGFKVILLRDEKQDCAILMTVWWPTTGNKRYENQHTSLQLVIKRLTTNQILAHKNTPIDTSHILWSFPDSGQASNNNLLPRTPNDQNHNGRSTQFIPTALDGSGYATTQYRLKGIKGTLAIDDPKEKMIVRWAKTGQPRPTNPTLATTGETITNIDFMLPLTQQDLTWFQIQGDTTHHPPRQPNPDHEWGTESWFILGSEANNTTNKFGLTHDNTTTWDYATPNTECYLNQPGRYVPTTHYGDPHYNPLQPNQQYQRFQRNIANIINQQSHN